MVQHRPSDQLAAVAQLHEPLRRRLYEVVTTSPAALSRDQAAAAVGVSRGVAAFHLDKLVAAGLLVADFARPPGRKGGPGAGRPTKFYRRHPAEIAVSLPERRYALAGALFAEAVTAASAAQTDAQQEARNAARRHGQMLGERWRPSTRRRVALPALLPVLVNQGYEPFEDEGGVRLRNCPFRVLARQHTELMCGMNLELIRGLLEAVDATGVEAALDPGVGRCCVRLTTTSRSRSRKGNGTSPRSAGGSIK